MGFNIKDFVTGFAVKLKSTTDGTNGEITHHITENLPTALGQAAKAGSVSVALASDDDLLARIGEVASSPSANTLLARLKNLEGYSDGLEGLITTLQGYVDGLEALVTSSNTKLDTLHTDLGTTLAALLTALNGYVDGLEALAAASIPAGENHIGAVGGHTRVVRPTITVQDTPDYADGDAVGGLITLTNFARVAAGSGAILQFQMRSLISIGVQVLLHVFDANPTSSTFTDNGALSIHSSDRAKLLKTIALPSGLWVAPKGASPFYTQDAIGGDAALRILNYELASGRDLYFALEADGAINFASTADFSAVISAWNN